MFERLRSSLDLLARGEAMRALHSRWLTRALQRGARPPRIPTRKVDPTGGGGWATLMATPEGRAWAEEFWQQTLDHPEAS
jgi:hypothetical protein